MPFSSSEPIPINWLATEFYLLEALKMLADNGAEKFKPSHERYLSDLNFYRDRFNDVVSIMMRDYLTIASAGEARHAPYKCSHKIIPFPNGGYRTEVVPLVKNYTAESLAKASQAVFEKPWYGGGYGGKKWLQIAKAALMYDRVPDSVFIDHAIDLSHNGGPAFNKYDYKIFTIRDDYVRFLDMKSQVESPQELIENILEFRDNFSAITFYALDLLIRGGNLRFVKFGNLIQDKALAHHRKDYNKMIFKKYQPYQWGDEDFQFELVPCKTYPCGNSEECLDEDYCNTECMNFECEKNPHNYDNCYEECDECPNYTCSSHENHGIDEEVDLLEQTFQSLSNVVLLDDSPAKIGKGVVFNVR